MPPSTWDEEGIPLLTTDIVAKEWSFQHECFFNGINNI
jgi:hypothetical protein